MEGRFEYVKVGNSEFSGPTLERHIVIGKDHGIKSFNYTLSIPIGENVSFDYYPYGIFRLRDRLIWTFQVMSNGLRLTVKSDTDDKNGFSKYIINHHNREKIKAGIADSQQQNLEVLDFGDHILPYQGFEISWDFNLSTK